MFDNVFAFLTQCYNAVYNWLNDIGLASGIPIASMFLGFCILRILIRYLLAPATGGSDKAYKHGHKKRSENDE